MTRETAKTRRRKRPRKVTPASLERAALHYLQRFATSSENFRRVLTRRVQRSAAAHGTDPEDGAALIDDLVARYQAAGLLDDAAYARMRAETLHRRGSSRRLIRTKLAAKGVASEDIDGALESLGDGGTETDLAAACNYARRRRIGPWCKTDRAAARDRHLAALGRQGFSYDIARRIVEAEDPETLEAEIAETAAR